MNARQLKRLMQLLSLPTAPFREDFIVKHAREFLERHKLPHFTDLSGNLVLGCNSATAYQQLLKQNRQDPVRLFIAHMDHPGFHGFHWLSPKRLLVKWHGGSPVRRLVGHRVWLADRQGVTGHGRIARVRLIPSRHALSEAEICVEGNFPTGISAHLLFGGFQFRSPAWRSGQLVYARAADDLVGVFTILETALTAWTEKNRRSPPFLGLLTRGEEVGFVGTIAHLEQGLLQGRQRPCVAISLETSRTLPGALIGHGPVIRLGDRRTVFHPDYLHLLSTVAEQILPGKHQRRVMDGGTCEATAAIAWGLPAVGISVPLGNYHNEEHDRPDRRASVRKADGRPAPEFVHLQDVEGMLKLCRALLMPGWHWQDTWKSQRARLRRNHRHYQPLLDT